MLSVITRILLAEARRTGAERRAERKNTRHTARGPGHASRRETGPIAGVRRAPAPSAHFPPVSTEIINAERESLAAAALGDASDTMTAHPLALQLRNLQSLVEIGVDQSTTFVFPAPS